MAVMVLVDKVDWKKALDAPLKAWEATAPQALTEMRDLIVAESSRESARGNRSKPGEYLKKISGDFVKGLSVRVSGSKGDMSLHSKEPYGKTWLEHATKARPWMSLALKSQDWMKRIADIGRGAFGR